MSAGTPLGANAKSVDSQSVDVESMTVTWVYNMYAVYMYRYTIGK